MKNPFMKYIAKEKKENIFHSSAYGKAQSAGALGATSTESFEERMKVEKNRQIIQRYNDSRIVSGAYSNGPRAKKYVSLEKRSGATEAGSGLGSSLSSGSGVNSATAGNSTVAAIKKTFVPPIKPDFGG